MVKIKSVWSSKKPRAWQVESSIKPKSMSKTIHGEEKTVRKTFGKRLTPIAAITAPAEKKGYIDGKKRGII